MIEILRIVHRNTAWLVCGVILTCCTNENKRPDPQHINSRPNIVIFYVDDLGYADIGCYGAKGVETPNVDRLAAEGIKFTDAHSPAATCTPSRYSLLTGEYAFRNKARVLPGDAPLLIDTAQHTLPDMLKRAGYRTAVVGKWHLGLGSGTINWNEEVRPGPLEIGFDYSFLMPATGDRVPTAYLENHHIVNLDPSDPMIISYGEKVGDRPTGTEHPELLRYGADPQHSNTIVNGISRIGYLGGGESALWVDEEFPDIFTDKAIQYVRENKDQPFFLFFPFHDIHVPRLPHPRFKDKSTMGFRGDAIVQMDWMTGRIIEELEALNLLENTMVIFTSDNGPVLNDGYEDQAVEKMGDHNPSGPFRGGKYSAFEAGTRVPTIIYWEGKIEPRESTAVFSQIDLYASLATLVGQELRPGEAPDSQDVLQTLLGKSDTGSDYLLEESYTLGIRNGSWKYIAPLNEGQSLPDWLANKDIEGGFDFVPQLYDLSNDLGEQNNIAGQFPEVVERMEKKLAEIVGSTD